ncbi:hypothetical protein SEA_UNTPL_41 [Streptomyces phage UNTPL]|jgi:hypothetical protein|nr:hypothetical protein SEA_UNTPL_41 [Streptomyces phage UNTPL]
MIPMAGQTDSSFEALFEGVKQLPGSWGPRREQPEWDRDFGGRADIQWHFAHRTDTAKEWMAFALGFSSTLIDGYEGLDEVIKVGRETIKTYAPKGKQQFEK